MVKYAFDHKTKHTQTKCTKHHKRTKAPCL
jgi:hypothetical protein